MKTLWINKLFTPIQVGSMELKHRVVMAPLTRSRSVQPGSIPGDLMLEYYSQRASEQGGEAALAHAGRGRPSHRRLPDRVRYRILQLARTTYAGFNDHHLCEKLVEKEGFSLGRETLCRLLRSAGIGSPRKRRAPTHR